MIGLITLLKRHFLLVISLFFFLPSSIYFLNIYSYQINPDGISLINIAKEIRNGQIYEAINAYWGVLFSLLLSPFLFLPVNPLKAEKILSILIGVFTIIGIYSLALKANLKALALSCLLICSVPLVIYFSMSITTTDLLQLTILIFYLSVISSENYIKKISNGFLAGTLGALGFFAKENGFFFFLIHFTLINLFYFLFFRNKKEKMKVARIFVVGFLTFILLSSVWISILGLKYHKLMLGSRGSYNWSLIGPRTSGHPRFYMGFLTPPTPHATSAWDDPTHPTPPSWNLFESVETVKFQLERTISNLLIFLLTINSFSLLSTVLFLLLFIYIFYSSLRKQLIKNVAVLSIFLTTIIYSSTYLVPYVEERYLWFDLILLDLFGCILFEKFYSSSFFRKLPNLLIKTITLIGSAAFILIISYKPVNYLKTPPLDKFFFDQGQLLLNKYRITNSNLASNGNWNWMLYYAFYTDGKYLGFPRENGNYQNLLSDFKRYDINYYFVWDNNQISDRLATDFMELKAPDIGGFRIFSIKR